MSLRRVNVQPPIQGGVEYYESTEYYEIRHPLMMVNITAWVHEQYGSKHFISASKAGNYHVLWQLIRHNKKWKV